MRHFLFAYKEMGGCGAGGVGCCGVWGKRVENLEYFKPISLVGSLYKLLVKVFD